MKRTEKEIIAALLETVRAHLRKLEVPAKDIDDLTQEVMLAAWEKAILLARVCVEEENAKKRRR